MRGLTRRLAPLGGFFVLLMGAPTLLSNEYYLTVLIMCCINAITVTGLNLLLGYAGQISLGHAAFYGIGAYATAVLTGTCGLPAVAGIVAGVLLAALVAWLIGIPTLKLEGNYLAMATLGFGIIVYIFFNETVELTGGPSGFVGIPCLEVGGFAFDTDRSFYYLAASVLALVMLVSMNLIDSRTGRALRALHTSEKAAQAVGVDIARYKLFIFVLSAAFAGLAGVLYAHYLTFIAPSSFGFLYSVELVVMVVLGGMASVWGSVVGAFFLTVLPEMLRAFEDIEILLYGGILILFMMFLPEGIAGGVRKLAARLARGRGPESEEGAPAPEEGAQMGGEAPVLRCDDVRVSFGGVRALDGVHLSVLGKAVNAVIGPNGAGKTTLLNAITGMGPQAGGAILLGDRDLTRTPPHDRSRAGIVRTFQNLEVFSNMSVLENVMTGAHAHVRYSVADSLFKTPRYFRGEAEVRNEAMKWLEFVGMDAPADAPAGDLSFGSQRHLELARALAARPSVLLLDEPAAGLNMRETRTLGALIARMRDELGLAVILVEHDMDLVMNISDRITVLSFGKVLAKGTPLEIQKNPEVIAAYLGGGDED